MTANPPTSPSCESPTGSIQVFYDGACPVCSREARHYCRRSEAGRLDFVDISAPDFRAEDHGLRQEDAMAALHARMPDGSLRVGVDAFRVIWQATPGMRWMAWLAGWPGVHGIMALGYRLFAANRHHLRRFSRKK